MPLREPRLIGKLFHEKLAALETSIDAGYGFDLVRLSAFATARFETEQGDLTGETASDDQDIALFADRVRARLGNDTLLRPMLIESHLPERAALLVPFDKSPPERVSLRDPEEKICRCPTVLRPSVRCVSSRTPSRSTFRRPRCLKARRRISAGAAPCTGSRARKAPNALRRNGG